MRVLFQIAICICLIILAGGTINYIHEDPTFGGGFLLFMVWGFMFVFAMEMFEGFKKNKKPAPQSGERLNTLEKRLTDIQDIVITIDEKLSRMERGADTPVKES